MGPFAYTGHSALGYPSYADTETGTMLVAEPGGSYGMRAVDGGPVPPTDGRWAQPLSEESGAPPGVEPPPPVPAVPPVPPVEGSETE